VIPAKKKAGSEFLEFFLRTGRYKREKQKPQASSDAWGF
jgi:hypothetical protein